MDVRVWVGCLAHYNNGDLVGEWVDAAEAGAWTCPKKNPNDIYINCEEYWVMDHEIPGVSGEVSPMTAVKWAEVFAEVDEDKADAFTAWIKWREFDNPGEINAREFEDQYRGHWDSEEAYGTEFACETLIDPFVATAKSMSGPYERAPGYDETAQEIINFFDFARYSRELFQHHGYHFDGGHVFSE